MFIVFTAPNQFAPTIDEAEEIRTAHYEQTGEIVAVELSQKVTPELYYIGFIPGVLATVLGTMLAGLAIYKREMSQLFKELET